jgi:Tol biopolymer transport system component
VTREGHAKILDFGLAKLIEPGLAAGYRPRDLAGSSPPLNEDEEIATAIMQHHSTPGAVIGTVGYMSPEQAQGRVKEIDQRSDIFSFGCILFEAATRRKPFAGKDALDSLHNTVHGPTPQIKDFIANAPEDLEKIVRRCLAKDPDERYHSIKDVAIEIKDLRRELHVPADTTTPPFASREMGQPGNETISTRPATAMTEAGSSSPSTQPSSAEYLITGIAKHKTGVGLTLAAVVLGAVVLSYFLYRLLSEKKPISFQSAKFTRLTTSGKAKYAAISPDGKWLVHVIEEEGKQSLWLRQVAVENSNTQVAPPAEVQHHGATFSRDGNYIYYTVFDRSFGAGTLYQVPVLGGAARKLLTRINSSVAFSRDGKRIAFIGYYDGEDRLMIANADGTGVRQLAQRHGNEFFGREQPTVSWSPDDTMIATPVGTNPDMSIAGVSVETGQLKFFTLKRWETVEHVWWLDANTILATAREQRSDNFGIWQVHYPTGEIHRLTTELNAYRAISLASDGKFIAAVQQERIANIWTMPAFDVTCATQITQGRKFDGQPVWTPDGKLIYHSWSGGNLDLYLIDSRGENSKQLTANSQMNLGAVISPNGRYVVFESNRAGAPNIWRMDIDGGNPKQLTDQYERGDPHISPDSQWVVYTSFANKQSVWKVPIDGGQSVQLTDKYSMTPAVSPDGKQIACIYQPAPDTPFKLAILPFEGGVPVKTFPLPYGLPTTRLRWLPDGSAVVYGAVSNLWAQAVNGSSLKQLTTFTSDRIFGFDFSRDGKQVAFSRGTLTSDVVLISGFK